MNDNERRHYQRIPFIADVVISREGDQWNCSLEDISLKGVLIEAPQAVTPEQGQAYDVQLVLGEGAVIHMAAEVSHITDSHWGMSWQNIDLEGLTHLRRLLELNMGDTDEMHRELAELG